MAVKLTEQISVVEGCGQRVEVWFFGLAHPVWTFGMVALTIAVVLGVTEVDLLDGVDLFVGIEFGRRLDHHECIGGRCD
jgi:hypothetical protein